MSGPTRITRRQLLALVVAAPLAVVPLAPADPVAAAYGELVEASLAWERSHAATGDLSAGMLPFVRHVVGLLHRLEAEHGDEAGGVIWRAAMHRHQRWQIARYGLPADA